MTEVLAIQKPVYTDLLSKSVDWFLYDKDLRHEGVNFAKIKEYNYFWMQTYGATRLLSRKTFFKHNKTLLNNTNSTK